ncbi:MAG: DUF1127 domain-containing protein [Alphaproteobacteria bacterium]|nr:DUF1127 domain-containing protein [Alphaproteobacteria bacterium]
MTTAGPAVPVCAPATAPGLFHGVLATVLLWLTLARSRRDLASLDDRALQDIGIDRATAYEESQKPFWRAF